MIFLVMYHSGFNSDDISSVKLGIMMIFLVMKNPAFVIDAISTDVQLRI